MSESNRARDFAWEEAVRLSGAAAHLRGTTQAQRDQELWPILARLAVPNELLRRGVTKRTIEAELTKMAEQEQALSPFAGLDPAEYRAHASDMLRRWRQLMEP